MPVLSNPLLISRLIKKNIAVTLRRKVKIHLMRILWNYVLKELINNYTGSWKYITFLQWYNWLGQFPFHKSRRDIYGFVFTMVCEMTNRQLTRRQAKKILSLSKILQWELSPEWDVDLPVLGLECFSHSLYSLRHWQVVHKIPLLMIIKMTNTTYRRCAI